jgi:CRISPR-associated protein Csb1
MIDYTQLAKSVRLLLEAPLRPVQGDRFQPTGFADIGPAVYKRPDENGVAGTQMLLVESAQSVANRLEKTCLDGDGPHIDPELRGNPYLVARLKGSNVDEIVTSSLVEPHRLASPYFLKTDFKDILSKEMGYGGKGQIDWKKIYKVLFKYDPNCLIHGVFLSLLEDGRVRVLRALTGFIEAENARDAPSGGVKNSPVDLKGEIQVDSGKQESWGSGVYSNVPYSRIEWVASKITAYFNLDTLQIRCYDLGEAGTQLLIALSLLKIRRFLASELRLRTACIFDLAGEVKITRPDNFQLPSEAELLAEVKRLIPACKGQFADPAVSEKVVAVKRATKQQKQAAAEQLEPDQVGVR